MRFMQNVLATITLLLFVTQCVQSQGFCPPLYNEPNCLSIGRCQWDTVNGHGCHCNSPIPMDILFALDVSGSMSKTDWQIEKQFLKDLVQDINYLDTSIAKIGFALFSTTVNFSRPIQSWDTPTLDTYLSGLYLSEGYTNTLEMISVALSAFDDTSTRQKLVIIFTDGPPCVATECPQQTLCQHYAEVLSKGIRVVIIAVNMDPGNTFDCLLQSTDDLISVNAFTAADFGSIQGMLTANVLCPQPPTPAPTFNPTLLPTTDAPTSSTSVPTTSEPTSVPTITPTLSPTSVPNIAPTFDCALCANYHKSASYDDPSSQWGASSPLTDHACADDTSDTSNCCTFSGEEGICAVFWDDKFLYPCNECAGGKTTSTKSPTTTVTSSTDDCALCTNYFSDASYDDPSSQWGTSYPLTRHACADATDTSNCCKLSGAGVCAVWWTDGLAYQFLYPCDECPAVQTKSPTTSPTMTVTSSTHHCASCTNYYRDASYDDPSSQWGTSHPLTGHACADDTSDTSNCCKFSGEGGICAVFWDDEFLYPCNECEDGQTTSTKNPTMTVTGSTGDCALCTNYYRDAWYANPPSQWGTSYPLTGHACADVTDTSDCCKLSPGDEGICAVVVNDEFVYPCDGCEDTSDVSTTIEESIFGSNAQSVTDVNKIRIALILLVAISNM